MFEDLEAIGRALQSLSIQKKLSSKLRAYSKGSYWRLTLGLLPFLMTFLILVLIFHSRLLRRLALQLVTQATLLNQRISGAFALSHQIICLNYVRQLHKLSTASKHTSSTNHKLLACEHPYSTFAVFTILFSREKK